MRPTNGSCVKDRGNGSGNWLIRRRSPRRPKWEDFTTKGLNMMWGLSKWQLPILTVADRGRAYLFQRLPNRGSTTPERAMTPLVPGDAVLWSKGANGYKTHAATGGLEHFVVGSKSGAHGLRLLSHTERELAPRPIQKVLQALLRTGHEEPQRLHPLAGGTDVWDAPGGDCARIVIQVSRKGLLRAHSDRVHGDSRRSCSMTGAVASGPEPTSAALCAKVRFWTKRTHFGGCRTILGLLHSQGRYDVLKCAWLGNAEFRLLVGKSRLNGT